MNKTFRSLMTLAMLATAAVSAQDAGKCQSNLHIRNVAAAMGPDVRIQPEFNDKGLSGWRVFGTKTSVQLSAQAIDPGSLMTHVCGMTASEIFLNEGTICCSGNAAKQFDVTFQIADQAKKVQIKQQP